jgi:micrococcal nuclease
MNDNSANRRNSWAGTCLLRALLLVLIVCAGYALYKQFLYEPPAIPEEGEQGLRMIRIIDGDTGELSSGATVRYLGIDTPESGEAFSFEATRFNTELCLDEPVRLEYDHRKRDKYERVLAYVFVEDTLMINETLVRTGLASVYIFPYDQKNMEYRRRLILAQMHARTEKRGIWSLPPPEPIEESYFGNPNSFRFHRPGCRSLRRTDKSRLLEYPTRDDFLDLGFSPCRICKP